MLGKIERVENLVQLASNELLTRDHKNLLYGITFGINQKFPDKEELSAKLLGMGVGRHTWFGSEELPKGRVISVSEHLPRETQEAVLALAEKLGFTRYNLFDSQMEEIEEDVLIGSYGVGDRKIPRTTA